MSFGVEFDDDVFNIEEKNPTTPPSQGGKSNSSECILDPSTMTRSDHETFQCLKHKADHQYFHKDFAEASISYEKCLRLIPAANSTYSRKCTEYLFYSLLNMGSPHKALEWALKMDATSSNADEKVHSLNLLARVCHVLGRHEEELEALHSCLESHQSNPDLWFRIASCYGGLFKLPLPNSSQECPQEPVCCAYKSRLMFQDCSLQCCHDAAKSGPSDFVSTANKQIPPVIECCVKEGCENNDSSGVVNGVDHPVVEKCEFCTLGVQMISACLLRARLLLENCEKSDFDMEKCTRMNQKINDCLHYLEVDQAFIDEASKMLTKESVPLV